MKSQATDPSMYCGSDDIGAVVADIGTSTTRIGFAGEDVPRACIPTTVGVYPEQEQEVITFDIHRPKPSMLVDSPVHDGVITDWNLLEKLWDYSLTNYLKVGLKDTPVLISEKPYNSPYNRQKLCEMMFEKCGVSAYFTSKDAVLSCYSSGKTSGLVVDASGSGTVITPVNDGWVDMKGVIRCVVGGRYQDSHLLSLLRMKGLPRPKPSYKFKKQLNGLQDLGFTVIDHPSAATATLSSQSVHPSYDSYMTLEVLRECKESVSRTADSPVIDTDPRFTNLPAILYELPDGTVLDIGIERYQLAELFFDVIPLDVFSQDLQYLRPSRSFDQSSQAATAKAVTGIVATNENLPKLVCDSVIRSDPEIQTTLLSNMILTGGASNFDGLCDRLRQEVEKIIRTNAPSWKVRMSSVGANERSLSAWLGGSILASLGCYHELWIAKSEYDEYGGSIVHRKCP